MPPFEASALAEAARLTRAGRLGEATALLQRRLGGAVAEPPAAMPTGAPSGRIFDVPEEAPAQATLRQRLVQGLANVGLPNIDLTKMGRPGMATASEPDILPAGARFLRGHYAGPDGGRDYRLYKPANLPAGPPPLVVMLHGCTQTPEDFAIGTRMNALAEAQGFLVAYPAQSGAANAQRCWNWFKAGDQRRETGEAALLAGLTRQVLRDHAADPRRVFAAGLSAGGAAAAILGATCPDLFAAIGVHSGLACGAARDMPSAFAAMQQGQSNPAGMPAGRVPVIVFHADRDNTVNPANGDQVLAQAALGLADGRALQARVSRGQVPGGHAFTQTRHEDALGRARLEQWVVHGGGHAWSGGDPAGSYTDARGPDASAAMLRFFGENPAAGA